MKQITLLAFALLIGCQSGEQKTEIQEKTNPPVTIALSEQFTLYSEHTQQEYSIYIHVPFSYAGSEATYPVVYQLDADIGFGAAAEMCMLLPVRQEMPEVILVGIAYGAYPGQEGNHRTRDFTPTKAADYSASGGADDFFSFLQSELIPVIDSAYRTKPEDRTISGASLSGLFSLYVLLKHPGVFQRYKISSPSIWWDNDVIFELEEIYAEHYSDMAAKVFISTGDAEGIVDAWHELIRILKERDYEGLELTSMVFKDAPHLTACWLAGCRGLRALFSEE
ncbi:MAG: alpha/beta hydrolase [Bacteroidales bacterium]|nr:alpha/beta hydrolase [Bacteroidales bacterium]